MQLSTLMVLLVVAGFAGWIDAVVGGGGLVQVPALLLAFPHFEPATALGTSKVAAIAGTAVAAGIYARRTRVDLTLGVGVGLVACGSAGLGALAAATVPSEMFRPLLICVLVAVAVFMAVRPRFGTAVRHPQAGRRRILLTFLVAGCLLGFYDGFIGPGTGTFLILALTGILGLDLVRSSANAKVINLVTYVGAITVFAIGGHVMWLLGAAMGVMNIVGARVGANMTLTRGAGFARVVLMLTVCGLAVRLAFF
ncbi:TSUP family transporter [Streptomyces sudanensis]|uniref:TSUP family transporter n=1 Tax=Streptomyces sudanensis TaxID=436397 RepID=UPI0020CC4736|nr:TSUP family transporter [Streptomyces sudanensis]MCP9987614.1 TSUP family transporter [Streptomyces sudanensis]